MKIFPILIVSALFFVSVQSLLSQEFLLELGVNTNVYSLYTGKTYWRSGKMCGVGFFCFLLQLESSLQSSSAVLTVLFYHHGAC